MNLFAISALMAMAPAPSKEGQSTVPFWANLVPIMLVFAVFYVALIRPQQRKAREHTELVKKLRPGDKVLTNGGIIGIVVGVKDKSVSIRSADTKLEIVKSAVTEILERTENTKES